MCCAVPSRTASFHLHSLVASRIHMPHFADLSPYEYGRTDWEGWGTDRNVGWLAKGHEVPSGTTPDDLVESLLVCATRPDRMYRGSHECDLCDVLLSRVYSAGLTLDPHPASRMDLDGREVELGNGEIRVCGTDGLWYTAPTLVAHYVMAHRYLPPTPFIDGVRARAKTIYVLRGKQLAHLRGLDFSGQLDAALHVLRALAAHSGVDVEPYVPRLLATVRGEEPQKPLHVPTLDRTPVPHAWWLIAAWFGPHHRDTTSGLIGLLEEAADAGLDVDSV